MGWFRFWDELTVNSGGNPIKGNNLFFSEFSPSVHSCSLPSSTTLTEWQKNCGSGATSWRSSDPNNGAAAFISSRVYVAGTRAPPRAEKPPACESFLLTASPSADGAGGESFGSLPDPGGPTGILFGFLEFLLEAQIRRQRRSVAAQSCSSGAEPGKPLILLLLLLLCRVASGSCRAGSASSPGFPSEIFHAVLP